METFENAVVQETTKDVVKTVEQKEFIFQAIKETVVLEEGKSYFEELNTKSEGKAKAAKLRKAIRVRLFEAMKTGVVKCKKDTTNDKVLRNYASLCVSHWINKDKRLK